MLICPWENWVVVKKSVNKNDGSLIIGKPIKPQSSGDCDQWNVGHLTVNPLMPGSNERSYVL